MSLTPVIIQSIISISVMVAIGIAVIGQVRWRATQEWESLAEARALRIEALEKEIAALKLAHQIESDSFMKRIQALEAQVAEVQRLNLKLQRQLSEGSPQT